MAACWSCGDATSTPRSHYCDWCREAGQTRRARSRRRYEARRPSAAERGYDAAHWRERAKWVPLVERGEVDCWRCGRWIPPGSVWHLGHDDRDRSVYRGPECVPCNCATTGRMPKRAVPVLDSSRSW
jgi:hypothetical protein